MRENLFFGGEFTPEKKKDKSYYWVTTRLVRESGPWATEFIHTPKDVTGIMQEHPREVFKTAFLTSSSSIVMCHNHPSGDPSPSREDIEITRKLIEAGIVLGIEVLDHIIVGNVRYVSFKESGFI
jgi:DNA repair protein RadC